MLSMNKLEYLKYCLTYTDLYKNKNWYISIFSTLLPDTSEKWKKNIVPFMLVKELNGLSYINSTNTLSPIVDAKNNEPLFRVDSEVEVDSTWMSSITEKLTTKVGRLIVNKLLFHSVVLDRVPYINSRITASVIQDIFVEKVKNIQDMTTNDISVKEMIEITNRVFFLTCIAELTNIAATEKNISRPTNIDVNRKALLDEYKDQLNDPVKVVELEKKLSALDTEYLKDDPSADVLLNKKSRKARKKMYLLYGSEDAFKERTSPSPIVNTLEEGLQTDEKNFPQYIQAMRYGSYSRGALTQLGGVQSKVMLRSLGSLVIKDEDCGTTRGLFRVINKDLFSKLIGREIKVNNKWTLIKDVKDIQQFENKEVEIRSAMYCLSKENNICYHCTNIGYKNQPNAIFNLSTEVTSTVTSMFLSLMHGVEKNSVQLSVDELFS